MLSESMHVPQASSGAVQEVVAGRFVEVMVEQRLLLQPVCGWKRKCNVTSRLTEAHRDNAHVSQ